MGAKVSIMWTRKASFTFTGGIALILIGMMITNNQMMILGLTLITFIVVNSWVSGHGDIEVQRTLSADNLYKGDDLYVELLVTNRSNRRTQLLDVYDNIPSPREYSHMCYDNADRRLLVFGGWNNGW